MLRKDINPKEEVIYYVERKAKLFWCVWLYFVRGIISESAQLMKDVCSILRQNALGY